MYRNTFYSINCGQIVAKTSTPKNRTLFQSSSQAFYYEFRRLKIYREANKNSSFQKIDV